MNPSSSPSASIPVFKDVVLIGGGHANVHVIKMLGAVRPLPGVRVTVVTKDLMTPYSGMIPAYVAGLYSKDECHIDMRRVCQCFGVKMVHAEVYNIDPDTKEIFCTDGRPPIRYDIVVINIGITPKLGSPDWVNHTGVIAVKPINRFADRWTSMLDRLLALPPEEEKRLVVVGGGAGGTELAFAVHYRVTTELKARGIDAANFKVCLLTRGKTVLAEHNRAMQATALRLLKEKGINVYLDCNVVSIEERSRGLGDIVCENGTRIPYCEVIWCTNAAAPEWLRATKLHLHDGFISVKATLESVSHPDVFSCGDVCHLVDSPRPKAGVFAVRAGPILVENITRKLKHQELIQWTPQSQFLGIIGVAPNYAFASKGPLCIEGEYVWKLKDKIDKNWIIAYQKISKVMPGMTAMGDGGAMLGSSATPAAGASSEMDILKQISPRAISVLSEQHMRCGGCGSKVGAQVLTRALRRLSSLIKATMRKEVVSGVGDDAALIRAPEGPAYLVQTIDYFRSFISDPFIFGKIAANHALSDLFAMNAEPVSALAICVVPYGIEEKVEDDLVQMLGGAADVLRSEGCALVGGHTAEGAEESFGLSCNGVVHPDRVLNKGPVKPGLSIILTKALGTGTILAADMKGLAHSSWVQHAIESMLLSNRVAAACLYSFGCRACTDVTGFGVMGHLIEMMQFEDVIGQKTAAADGFALRARIFLPRVPTLCGATECIERGVFSTLHPQNVRCARAIINPEVGKTSLIYPLLFDPQTSGGLLAAVPSQSAEATVAALKEMGYSDSVVIGEFFSTRSQAAPGEFEPSIWVDDE